MTAADRAARLIEELGLVPHPEGGWYRELHRSAATVTPADGRPPRAALTTIYFLLPAGEHSRWHRVASDEVWHFYEGHPIELLVAPPDLAHVERVRLGPALGSNGPVHTVPAGWWQAIRGAWWRWRSSAAAESSAKTGTATATSRTSRTSSTTSSPPPST